MSIQPTLDEFIALLVDSLRAHLEHQQKGRLARSWSCKSVSDGIARRERGGHGFESDHRAWELLPEALEAAWELVRRGILRPGAEKFPTVGPGDGTEFSLTQAGRAWLASADETALLLLQPGALARTLADYAY